MTLITHFWQANIALLLCYAVYWAFLRRDTFFRWNRFYLLFALAFALALPLLPVPVLFQDAVPEDQVLLFFGEENVVTETSTQVAVTDSPTLFTWENALLAVYLIGVAFLFIRLIFNLLVIAKLVFKNKFKNTKQGYFIVQTNTETPIFSFLNVLFWNENTNISEKQKAKILAHELVHIRQWHSLDVLLMELMTVVFWCNPIVWAYKKSLQAIHEYLADAKVLERETSKTEYANLLVSQFLQTNTIHLTNPFFNKSLLKNRINMMYQKESKKIARLKYGFVVPMLALCLLVAACNEKITDQFAGGENSPIDIFQSNDNQVIKIDLNKITEEMRTEDENGYNFSQISKKTIKVESIKNLKMELLQSPYPLTKRTEICLAREKRIYGVVQKVENVNQIKWENFLKDAQAGDRFIIELNPEGGVFQLSKKLAEESMEKDIERTRKAAKEIGTPDDYIEEAILEIREKYFPNYMKVKVYFTIYIQ